MYDRILLAGLSHDLSLTSVRIVIPKLTAYKQRLQAGKNEFLLKLNMLLMRLEFLNIKHHCNKTQGVLEAAV